MEKVMMVSDQQIPYQDNRALKLTMKVMKAFKPDHVIYAGDWTDNDKISRWNIGGSREFLIELERNKIDINDENVILNMYKNEAETRQYFEDCREILPDARMVACGGNHDMTRVYRYFDSKRPDVLQYLTPETLWGFKTLGIDFFEYEDRPQYFAGDFYIHHGVGISQHAGQSVMKDNENFGVSLIRGHCHRQALVNRSYPLLNKTIVGVELGHLMDINCSGASYDNVHNWQLGFGVGYISDGATDTSDGKRLDVELVPISRDYTCVVGGKLFKG